MPRSTPAAQQVVRTGLNPALTAPDALGDVVTPGNVFLYVLNGSGSPITVTVKSTKTVDGLTVPDLEVTVGAAATRFIGPFPKGTFARASDVSDPGKIHVDYSAVASVTRAVIAL